jgi:predicted deacylase
MHTDILELQHASPGQRWGLTVMRFGPSGGPHPKAMVQAALHADEVPAMLVAQRLRARLQALEASGALLGEVILVPYANPVGLGQQLLGQHQGRFDLQDGINFNRNVALLGDTVAQAVAGQLTQDVAHNVICVRAALRAALAAVPSKTAVEDLKNKLLALAVDADVVLDLHCDSQAVMHLYALTPQADLAAELGALLGAQAVLLATESGDSPFDEACSRPWLELQQRFPSHPIPLACFSTTVELRGEGDTDHGLALADADAILAFLRRRGIVAGAAGALPPARCQPTPLSGSEPIVAPHAGVLVFHLAPGAAVQAGDVVADVVDIDSGAVTPICARSAGVLYARVSTRWASAGMRVAKVAGTSLMRTGKLLSP